MAKIIISDLLSTDIRTFLQNLPLDQAENILGSDTVVDLSNIQDGINTVSSKFALFSMDSNKLFTIDLSRLTINMVFMFPVGEPQLLSLIN
jgi:hypothetical protein